MVARFHRPVKIIAFNANGILRQCYELSKQQQDFIEVALLSEARLKPHKKFFIPNYLFYWTDHLPGRIGRIGVAVKKGICHNHVDVPPLVSIEATATRVCIPIGSNEMLLTAEYKSPDHTWNDADITELLSFRRKSLLAGDRTAKHPFWNGVVPNPSGPKLLNLLNLNEFELSALQCPTHHSAVGNGMQKNIQLSEVIVFDILGSDHIPIIFHLLDHIRTRNLLDPVDKFMDWEWFQSLVSELILHRIKINPGEVADKVAHNFTASVASAYRLSTSKITLLDLSKDLRGLKSLLKHK
jgi:hypothetical protein